LTIDYQKDHPLHSKAGIRPPHCPICYPAGPPTIPIMGRPVSGDINLDIPVDRGPIVPTQPQMKRLSNGLRTIMQGMVIDMPPSPEPDPDNRLNDGGPPCSMCHGGRRVRMDVAIDNPGFGKSIVCPSCDAGFLLQRRIDRVLKGLPELYREWRLDTFPQDTQNQIDMLSELCEWRFAASDNPRWSGEPWLYLWGPSGHCKSGLMTGLIVDAAARGLSTAMVKTDTLLASLRATYSDREEYDSSENQIMAALDDVYLLGMDDIGSERHKRENGDGVDWATEKLHQVIGDRHDKRKRMILTSNLSLNQLTRTLGHERTASRIEEACGERWYVRMHGLPNLRRIA
jgi:DNA replication protein DnaC